ncbi:SNARE protein, putative [Plasmodium relictum]|uniref:SNARE protein, putative n=1 Tax=Plasmodium relictum TaxID=85471 RepID=A0A1J1H745_PLARL|nr:SNARE protein, putative [Plasmodium relictum]CRH00365.1 SNARE protein, putative [Plasmodium relictum]
MDLWEKDYQKALENGKEIKKILRQNEKEKKKAKNRAILRGKITEFNQNIKFLTHQLNNDYIKNDKIYQRNITKYKNKMCTLEKLKKEISTLYEDFTSTNKEDVSLSINMDNINDFDNENDLYINDLNKEELLLKQQSLIKLQDEQLNFLEGTTHNLKNISYNINNELNVHNELLDDIDKDIDETNNLLNRNRNIFTRVTSNTSNYFLYVIIGILTTTLILFIILL